MYRGVLESSIQLAIIWFYENKLFSLTKEEGLDGISSIMK